VQRLPDDPKRRSATQRSLGSVMFLIAVLALVLSIVARAVRSDSDWDFLILGLSSALFGILAVPVLLLGLVIGLSPTARPEERAVVGLVVKTLLVMILLGLSMVINLG
jgi:hypothetical protein